MNISVRNKGIDIVKALSLISVIIYHLYEAKGTYLGVIPFFVISGYMITKVLVEREESYFLFIKNRIIKIYPALVTILAFTIVLFNYFNGFINQKIIYNSISSLFGVSNIYQITSGMSYFERSGDIFPLLHTWTLSMEIQFYLFFPFLIYFFKRKNIENKKVSYILFILSLISAGVMFYKSYNNFDISEIYYGTDTRIFALLIGAVFYYYFKDKEFEENKLKFLGRISILIILVSIFAVDYSMEVNYLGLMYIVSIASGFLLLATLRVNFLNFEGRTGKILSILGEHSYVYYLWQYPIMVYSNEYFKWSDIPYFYTVIIQIIILIIISEISYIFLEKRRNMSKRFGILFLFVYLATMFVFPFNKQMTADIIRNRIDEINSEMGLKTFNFDKENENKKKIEISKEDNQIDLMERRLLGLEEKEEIPTREVMDEKEPVKEVELLEIIKEKESETAEEKVEKIQEEEKEKITAINKKKTTFIGDSVMKMGEPYIKERFSNSYVDAKVSRQFTDLPNILEELSADKKLSDIVVIHLGTNGVMNKKSFEKTMELLKGKKVYFMNCVVPKHWEETVNNNIKEWSKDYSDVKIIDWYKYAKGKKDLFYKDATHPKPEGAKEYAEFILENVK